MRIQSTDAAFTRAHTRTHTRTHTHTHTHAHASLPRRDTSDVESPSLSSTRSPTPGGSRKGLGAIVFARRASLKGNALLAGKMRHSRSADAINLRWDALSPADPPSPGDHESPSSSGAEDNASCDGLYIAPARRRRSRRWTISGNASRLARESTANDSGSVVSEVDSSKSLDSHDPAAVAANTTRNSSSNRNHKYTFPAFSYDPDAPFAFASFWMDLVDSLEANTHKKTVWLANNSAGAPVTRKRCWSGSEVGFILLLPVCHSISPLSAAIILPATEHVP